MVIPIGNIGLPELIIILVIILIIFGPSKIPEIARNLGIAVKEFRNAVSGEEAARSAPQAPERKENKTA